MIIHKALSLRGKKDIVCIFDKYTSVAGGQDISRPQATVDFIKYLASLPKTDGTVKTLKAASIAARQIDVSSVADEQVPDNIKINIQIEEEIWLTAMDVFRFAFDLDPKRDPQMPFLLKVSGMAYMQLAEKQNAALKTGSVMPLDSFVDLSIDEKLNEIYKVLLSGGLK